jgi:hypothetical protein
VAGFLRRWPAQLLRRVRPLAASDRPDATGRLTRTLGAFGPTGAKQRSIVLADLANACGDDGDQAADYLNQARDALNTDWYGTGFTRVQAVRTVLTYSRHGRQLDERIAALAAAGRTALPGR